MTRRVMGMLAFFTLADVEKRYRHRTTTNRVPCPVFSIR